MAETKKSAPWEQEADKEAYQEWKAGLAERGKAPEEVVVFYKSIGKTAYAEELEAVIRRMEEMFEVPVGGGEKFDGS